MAVSRTVWRFAAVLFTVTVVIAATEPSRAQQDPFQSARPPAPRVAPPPRAAQPAPPRAGGFPVPVGQAFRDCPDCPEMVVIPAGRFTMGSPDSEANRDADEGPQREVRVGQALAVGRFHITVTEYRRFVEATRPSEVGWCATDDGNGWLPRVGLSWRSPGFAQGDRHPVVCVSWEDARAYAVWLSSQTGRRYRLLTEAEWEYAARAGTTTRYWWGDGDGEICQFANLGDQTGFPGNASAAQCRDGYAYTSPVGSFPANRFGLHDMAGNAWQWIEDCYARSYAGAPADATVAVVTPGCRAHVQRGGTWGLGARVVRSADRGWNSTGLQKNDLGFRLARTPGG